ncbi:MAG: hypothetical protein ACTSXA_03190 [Candidatus Heimdallarchaeota archaeon]
MLQLKNQSKFIIQLGKKYIVKKLIPTMFTINKMVVSERVAYLYCEESEIEEVIFLSDLLIHLLTTFDNLTRDKIVEYTNISRTTIYDTLMKLVIEDKVTVEYLSNKNKRGRPFTIFKITSQV